MDSECDETWQAACLHYNKTARQVATHSENIFMPLIKYISEVPRARASVSGLRTENGENLENPNGYKF